MPMIPYRDLAIGRSRLEIIDRAVEIARTYSRAGDSLTLRQLYYRFVANGWIDNKQSEYKRLGDIINDARYAGLMDWRWITDRTRNKEGGDGGDEDPAQVVRELYFYAAIWAGQTKRVEVWVEKDALKDVVARAANPLRTPYFSCRGYTSASEVWAAAQRIEGYLDTDEVEEVLIIHLGDHDPSGIDMTRDITDRLSEFLEGDGYDSSQLVVDRIALNMPQVELYSPPPNPAKLTDSRSKPYIRRYGPASWELDALEPAVLRQLITDRIRREIDPKPWGERMAFQTRNQTILDAFGDHYEAISNFLISEGLVEIPETTEDGE